MVNITIENVLFRAQGTTSSFHFGEEFFEVDGYKFNEKELVNLRRFCFQTNILDSYNVVNNIENQTAKVTVIRRKEYDSSGPLGVKKTLNLAKKSKVRLKNTKTSYYLSF